MKEIASPLCLIQGDQDAFGTFAQLDLIAENCSALCAIHRLAGHGHEPHKTALEVVTRLCAEHIASSEMPGLPAAREGTAK